MITKFKIFENTKKDLFMLIDKYPLSFFKTAILNSADINMTTSKLECVLSYAIINKKYEHIDYMINNCDDLDYESLDLQHRTPIALASYNEEIDIVKKLVPKANVNTVDNHGNSILMTALLLNSQSNLIDYLITIVDWNIINRNGEDLFDFLSDKYADIYKEKYKEKYKDYLLKKDLDKFNI